MSTSRPPQARATPQQPRLTPWELVGAWTGIWTAPKDIEVPPVPVRKLALWGVAGLLVIAGILALVIPPLENGKRAGAARLAREEAQQVAATEARLRADQRVHSAPFSSQPVTALERAITADAKARVAARKLAGPISGTKCSASSADAVLYQHSRVFKCFVTSNDNIPGEGKDVLATGYPFVATIYYAQHRVAWCKENPQPGEKTRGKGLAHVAMSKECAGKLAPLL